MLHAVHDVRVEEIPMPRVAPSEVLVEIRVVGICGSDVHFYERGSIGPFVVREPLVMGHEPFGVVIARGADAHRHPIGTRVAVEPGLPCGRCRMCRSGAYNLCPEVEFMAIPPKHGALARYVVVHEDFVHPVPDSLDDEVAALIEPLAVSLYAVRRAGVRAGSRVLVTGSGPIGLLCLQCALAAGATRVAVTDVRESALQHACRQGATQTLNVSRQSLDELQFEPEILLECSGNPTAMADGTLHLSPRGTAVLVGVGPEDASLPVARIRRRELTVTATFRYCNIFPLAIELATTEKIDLKGLITDRYSLEQTPDAFATASQTIAGRDSGTVKALIDLR